MTKEQIKYMAERFLAWKLPPDFHPDSGVEFQPVGNIGTKFEFKREPVGTNLLNYSQAEAMVRYLLDGIPAAGSE